MNALRLIGAAALLAAALGAAEATASPQEAPLVTEEALEGLPLTTSLEEIASSDSMDAEEVESAPMIPEPAGIALIGGGLLAMIVMRRRLG